MKPDVFNEPWMDVVFNLRDASKILLHFHTLGKLTELQDRAISDFFYSLDERLSGEEGQLIHGYSEEIAAKLIEYSNDVLHFYTNSRNQFLTKEKYDKLRESDLDDLIKVDAFNYIESWCPPVGKLSDREYEDFVTSQIMEGCWFPPLAYEILKAMKYEEFLKTKYWMSISRYVREKAGKCEECGAKKNLQVHHISYEHHGCEHSHIEDLKCLCKDCHAKAHHQMENKS